MKIRPLVIDEDAKTSIKKVKAYAENNPYTVSRLKLIGEGKMQPPGDDPNYGCNINFGYKCVYTLDQGTDRDNGEPIWVRHLSVSVEETNKWPNEHAVDLLMKEFGFRQTVTDKNAKLIVWLENKDDFTKPQAVNVAERYDEEV